MARIDATANGRPFRPFFALAALDAIAGVVPPAIGSSVGVWHRQELLLGMVPAVLAGFLLTALPRWAGRSLFPHFVTPAMLALWLLARFAGGTVAALFIVALTLIVTWHVFVAASHRDIKVAALLAALSAGAMMADDFGSRLALAAILGLVMVLGGRIIPAVTAAWLGREGDIAAFAPRAALEIGAAATATAALIAWVVAPDAPATAVVGPLAALGQVARLTQWRFWRVLHHPEILVLHVAYGWIAVGFAGGGIHAWTTGAIGTMCLGVMASMLRRQMKMAFEPSMVMSAAFAFVVVAAVTRVLADGFVDTPGTWLIVAAASWIAAYALFLVFFIRILLTRSAAGRSPPPRP